MNNSRIELATLEVFKHCNIQSFPIDCLKILEMYKYKTKPYSSQKPKKKEKCLSYSDDAFIVKNIVYYNDDKIVGRVRFSLAHEIGHIILKHQEPRTKLQEDEADLFASYLLAPRMALHYAKCKKLVDISELFNISHKAAQIVYEDYCKWYKWKAKYKMSVNDKKMYEHFYNDKYNGFVYSIDKCRCGKEIYNTKDELCSSCSKWMAVTTYNQSDNYLYGGY